MAPNHLKYVDDEEDEELEEEEQPDSDESDEGDNQRVKKRVSRLLPVSRQPRQSRI